MADWYYFLDIDDQNLHLKFKHLNTAIQSDDPLSCALKCEAFIDKGLVGVLRSFLLRGSTTTAELLGSNGMAGSLSSRARLAYSLGIIEKRILKNIEYIGRIRNKFAHSHTALDFKSKEVAELCAKLELVVSPEELGDQSVDEYFEIQRKEYPRNCFIDASLEIISELVFLPRSLKRPNTPFIDVSDD